MIRLRYAGVCSGCKNGLAIGTMAWWDAGADTTTCLECERAGGGAADQPEAGSSSPARGSEPAQFRSTTGEAGGSARREYEKRHARRAERLDQRWGPLASVVKLLSDDPQSTRAWAKGAQGERRLAARLSQLLGDRAVLLHDRKVPRTRGNLITSPSPHPACG